MELREPTSPAAGGAAVVISSSIIEKGTVHEVLPADKVFAVYYPGYPSSMARAIQTLGGVEQITKSRSLELGKLELRFRPEDPCCHPAFGNRLLSSSLLLRVSKKRCHRGPCPSSPPLPAVQLSAKVVARVLSGYHFEGMVDFQHVLAVHAADARNRKRHEIESEEPQTDEGPKRRGFLDSNGAEIMMLVPPLFSPKDTPQDIVIKSPANLISKQLQLGFVHHSWEMNIETCIAIEFNIESVPKKVNWQEIIPKDSDEWKLQMAVCDLFEERPIWPRWSFTERLLDDGIDVNRDVLNRLFLRSGYYFSNGPFGRFWIRKGYDPRKDPGARIFQRVDFRMPFLARKLVMNTNRVLEQNWKDISRFQVFPSKQFVCLQLFELDDDFIQEEIKRPLMHTSFTHSTGWFSYEMNAIFTLRVKMRFLMIFPTVGVEALLKSTKEKFDKMILEEAVTRYRKCDEEKGHMNKDPDIPCKEPHPEHGATYEHEDHDRPNGTYIRDQDQKEAENNEEEEHDEVEILPSVGKEESLSVETHSHVNGENANNFLQEFLSAIPFIKEAKEGDLAGNSHDADMEYEILEEDSDADENYYE